MGIDIALGGAQQDMWLESHGGAQAQDRRAARHSETTRMIRKMYGVGGAEGVERKEHTSG